MEAMIENLDPDARNVVAISVVHKLPGRLRLVYSGSPIGVVMHLGEITWALNRKLHPGRVAMPVLHLLFAFSLVGVVLHVGELIWALAPFVVPDQRRRTALNPAGA